MLPNVRQINHLLGDRFVLVIEPSINYRMSIKQFLANIKAKNIKVVGSAADAQREMLTRRVGLFIVEWSLDELNGLQFCRQMRREKIYKTTPFLLLSVENLRKDVVLAAEVEIDGYLLKPFSYEEFCQKLLAILKAEAAPNRLSILLDAADDFFTKKDLAESRRLCMEALALNPRSARGMCALARLEKLAGKVNEAIDLLRAAAAENPEFIEAHREMLHIAEERDDRAGMIHAATILHQQSPENPRYTLVLARVYLEMKHLEGALAFFKKSVSLSPRLAAAYKGLGNVFFAREEYEKAMKSYKKALDLDAGDVGLLNSLGLAHIRLGQYKEGIERYMMALKLDAKDPRVLFNIGHAFEKRSDFGDVDKSKWYYAQALVHNPGYAKAQRGLDRLEKALETPTERFDEFEMVEDSRADLLKKSS